MKLPHRASFVRLALPCALAAFATFGAACQSQAEKRESETTLASARTSCEFASGALPSETIGREYPVGSSIPIDHFFLFMQENRSFDHYFGTMPGVDGLPAGASNPDGVGGEVAAFHTDQFCIDDTAHSWDASHLQWNDGANDGFVLTNGAGGERAMGYFDETDLGYYHALFGEFAMSQRHFCSMLGPTWVNRMYMTSGTSFGLVSNVAVPDDRLATYAGAPYSIYQQLDAAGVEWRVYYTDVATAFGIYPEYAFTWLDHFRPFTQLAVDLASGDVAPVNYVEPAFSNGLTYERNDEHPPTNPQRGQAWVAARVAEIMNSAAWASSAIVLAYDEHGGLYDHVPPPSACKPDDFPLVYKDGTAVTNADVDRYGFRVPLAVVSPFARRGYVSNEVTDHASILRLVQARFGLPALTNRDANAWPLLDMFDFDHPDESVPVLPAAVVDPDAEAACAIAFP